MVYLKCNIKYLVLHWKWPHAWMVYLIFGKDFLQTCSGLFPCWLPQSHESIQGWLWEKKQTNIVLSIIVYNTSISLIHNKHINLFQSTLFLNPFTPESDQCQNSPAASQEIWHHTVWRTWLFIAYSDEKWLYYKFSLHHSYNRFLKGWENTLFELRIKRVNCHEVSSHVWVLKLPLLQYYLGRGVTPIYFLYRDPPPVTGYTISHLLTVWLNISGGAGGEIWYW